MTLVVSDASNDAALVGRLMHMDAGADHARVRIYAGATMVAEIALTKPAGVVASGYLTLTADDVDGVLAAATGVADSAKIVNGNGDDVCSGSVSDPAGSGDFKINITDLEPGEAPTQIYLGGRVLLGVTRFAA